MLGSAGINRVRISPTNAGQAALIIGSNGNLDKLGTITNTSRMFQRMPESCHDGVDWWDYQHWRKAF